MPLRQPIVCVLGHVDHGKTLLLDAIRETSVAKREAGAITQAVGASIVPVDVVKKLCGSMLEALNIKLSIPGLLMVDTPGHEAFANLRKRGGSIADIAILVIDVNQGIQPQTVEAIEILREYKTPFVIALNKIDSLTGWIPQKGKCFADSAKVQRKDVLEALDQKIYDLVGELYKYQFQAERFDRVTDFTKQVVVVPVSAKTREGLQEVLMFVAGLAQKFLEKRLEVKEGEQGKGAILEVREERGLGKTLDVILYEGILEQGSEIAFSTLEGPRACVAKALLEPKPLDEMRDPKEKFNSVAEVSAATGVKIACEHAAQAIPGSSVFAVAGEQQKQAAFKELERELSEILFETEAKGIVLKADALGSIEAITKLLKAEGIPIRVTGIGAVSHNDVMKASAMKERERFLGVIFAFNVQVPKEIALEAEKTGVNVFEKKIIYNLLEGYKNWKTEAQERERREAFEQLVMPAKVVVMQGCCFRVSNPCIVGVEVVEGRIRPGYILMNEEGKTVGKIKAIQHEKENISEARKGQQIAISVPEPFFGRQICEKQVLYSNPSREDVDRLEKNYLQALNDGEKDLLKEIKKIKGYSVF